MPARLHFSNSLDALADRLMENIGARTGENHGAGTDASERTGVDPFVVTSIATPASAMRDWLKARIAEKTGIAVNIAFPHLENLLWDRLAERDPERETAERQPARLLEALSFQGLILSHLRQNPPPALHAYLNPGDAIEEARRCIQLSGRLAALFREYEYSRVAEGRRPGLAESWMNGTPCFDPFSEHPDMPALEGWQMSIYRALFQRGEGLRDRWGAATLTYRYTLPQYAAMIVGKDAMAAKTGFRVPDEVATVYHLFGLSNISPFHRDLIGRLADEGLLGSASARFEIYALNPCAEFWEDAITDRERQARSRKRQARPVPAELVENARPTPAEIERGTLDEPDDENGLLAAFGKPGRETIKLWCQLTGHDFTEDFRPPRESTLLAAVQNSVLSRLGKLPPPHEAAPDETTRMIRDRDDDSLRVFSAPDPRTELEEVRAAMARRLREDKTLRPEDLALIPADPEAALPLIRAVFAGGAEAAGNVPVLFPGTDTPAASLLLRGFRDLLSPAVLAADRNAVLALLENPAVRGKADLAAERLPAVRRFWEAAGFQEGWGEQDAFLSEGAAASTARAAEQRAVLARVLDPDDEAVAQSGFWPAAGVSGLLERDESARLVDWMARLRVALRPFLAQAADGKEHAEDAGDMGDATAARRSWSEWAGLLRNLLDGFLRAEDADAADRRAELDLRGFLAEMEGWDHRTHPPERVAPEFVRTLFEDAFRDPGTARAAFLRGGVRVGGLMALRGIPFRHVWVTGLAAGVFPAPGESAPLDLRGYRRLAGESDPAARDLYALLEVIASATQSLTLSWVRRDAAKDASVSPSRALTGLKAWLDADVLAQGENVTEFPFEHLHAAPLPLTGDAGDAARAAAWAENPPREVFSADWSEVAEFLDNPAVHAARIHFGLRPYDALDFAEEERAAGLFLDLRADEALLNPVLRAELEHSGTGMDAFDRLWAERARGGLLPPQPYDAVEHDRLQEAVAEALTPKAERLRALLAEKNLRFAGSLRAGPQDSKAAEPPVVSVPAFITQTAPGVPVKLGGILPWFFQDSGSGGEWAVMVEDGKEVPLYLLHLCVSAMEESERPFILRGRGHVIVHKKSDNPEKAFGIHPLPDAWGDREAKNILRDLITDLASGPHFDDLPLKGIAAIHEENNGIGPVADWSEAVEDWRRDEEEKSFGGPRFWDRMLGTLQVAVPGNAGELVARRALPYLIWKKSWVPPKSRRGKTGNAEAGEAVDDAEAAETGV